MTIGLCHHCHRSGVKTTCQPKTGTPLCAKCWGKLVGGQS